MSDKWTPGPWSVGQLTSRVRLLEGDDTGLLCREISVPGMWIAQVSPKYGEANARLIAQAPLIVKQLRGLIRGIDHYRMWFDTCTKTEIEGWEDEAASALDELERAQKNALLVLSAIEGNLQDTEVKS